MTTPRMGPPLDQTKTHQVRLSTNRNKVYVSCNCRKAPGLHEKAGKMNHSPIGSTQNFDETKRLYNDPDNHWAEFTKEDMLP